MGLIRLAQGVSKYCIGMEGNVSARFDSYLGEKVNGFIIKRSGAKMSDIQYMYNSSNDNFVAYDLEGNQLDNFNCRGSIETDFHRVIYSKFKEVQFIAHTHPVNTLKILCGRLFESNLFALKRMYPEQVIFNGRESLLVSYACPGKKLADLIAEQLSYYSECPKLILLKNHGIIACGKSANECVSITETCEKSAEIFSACMNIYEYGAILSDFRFLSELEVEELLDNEQEKYRMGQLK